MEDTKSLLIMVLHKIFHDRPKIVENTYQIIYNYNNGKKEKSEYEKTLKSICDLMNDELPSEILVYLLTLVDMPQEDGVQLPVVEKIQKTYSCLAESVRPSLLEYLSNKKLNEKHVSIKDTSATIQMEPVQHVKLQQKSENKEMSTSSNELRSEPEKSSISDDKFVKPTLKRTRSRKKIKNNSSDSDEKESVKSLLDITANYVVKNESNLKVMYKSKLSQAWKAINSNAIQGETLQKYYNAVHDFNKKTKFLRCIENDNITEDILMEEYGESEIFFKNQLPLRDPFVLSDEITEALRNFIYRT